MELPKESKGESSSDVHVQSFVIGDAVAVIFGAFDGYVRGCLHVHYRQNTTPCVNLSNPAAHSRFGIRVRSAR